MLEIREEIAEWIYELWFEPSLPYNCGWMAAAPDWKQTCYCKADQILDTKAGNHTLKELIEMIDKGELVKLAKDQSLPDNPTSHRTRVGVDEYWLGRGDGYNWAQKDMLKPDKKRRVWVRVEPLK